MEDALLSIMENNSNAHTDKYGERIKLYTTKFGSKLRIAKE